MIYKKKLLQQLHKWVNTPSTQLEDLCKIVLQYFVDKKHLEEVIQDWIAENYGNSEANDPAYNLNKLTERIEEAIYDKLIETTRK